MYKEILVAIDGSGVAGGVFESALQLAKAGNAQLFALHVIECPKFYLPDAGECRRGIHQDVDPTCVVDPAKSGR